MDVQDESDNAVEQLLRILVGLAARQVFNEPDLRERVAPRGGSDKQVLAYNLCDGSLAQSEVAKKVGLDQGNFSRTVARWVSAGILFRLGEGKDAKLLHLYPLNG